MPPLPTIPNVYRVSLEWDQANGIQPNNVMHIAAVTGTVDEVAAAIEDAHTSVIGTHNPWAGMSSSFELTTLKLLPLDGTSAEFDFALSTPWAGSASGEIIPASAAVMSFHTIQRGARGRGRMYVGPTTEGSQINGLITGTVVTEMTAGWIAFQAALLAESPSLQLVVASYVHADANDVTSFRCDSVAGTQRRRQDQLR